jgi:glucose repression regulatory protein TUP1
MTDDDEEDYPPTLKKTSAAGQQNSSHSSLGSSASNPSVANAASSNRLEPIKKRATKRSRKDSDESPEFTLVPAANAPTNLAVSDHHTLVHTSVVCCVRFSRDGRLLATGSNNMTQIFDVYTGDLRGVIREPTATASTSTGSSPTEDSYVRSVCFSPDGNFLATGAEDKVIKVWHLYGGDSDSPAEKSPDQYVQLAPTLAHTLVGHELDIYGLDFSPDGRLLVSGSGDGRVRVWDWRNNSCVHVLSGPRDGVTSVAVSPCGTYVAAGALDSVVRVWDLESGDLLYSFEGHTDSVHAVAFRPDCRYLASGSLDRSIHVWDMQMAKSKGPVGVGREIRGHQDFVLSLAYAPDGDVLVSASKDRSVQFWDAETLQCLGVLQGHKNSVISVAVSPSGKMVATGSGDLRARLWMYSITAGHNSSNHANGHSSAALNSTSSSAATNSVPTSSTSNNNNNNSSTSSLAGSGSASAPPDSNSQGNGHGHDIEESTDK